MASECDGAGVWKLASERVTIAVVNRDGQAQTRSTQSDVTGNVQTQRSTGLAVIFFDVAGPESEKDFTRW